MNNEGKGIKVRPMLAGKLDLKKLEFPVFVQPKYDGIRAIIRCGVAYSRTLKPIRNKYIQACIAVMDGDMDGLDGELVVGDPTASDCYRKTSSGVMSAGGKPNFMYIAFDVWDCPDLLFKERMKSVRHRVSNLYSIPGIKVVVARTCHLYLAKNLALFYNNCLEEGFEGIIVRSPTGTYKYNRSTTNEGYLLKHKPFKDAEAVIIGFQEKMHNANPAEEDERGYTKRSSHQENKVPQNTLGALCVSMLDGTDSGSKDFNIGTGFDDIQRQDIWDNREVLRGSIIKFKYADIGDYDVPRFPVFLGFRDRIDL